VRTGGSPYRGRGGQWAFVGHRVSGFLVFLFLLLHIVDVSLVRWPAVYDEVHRLYGNVLLRAFAVGLLFALLFHALNGLGKTVALYRYPNEDHGPAARETLLDLWSRWAAWLDKYVKNPQPVTKPAPAANGATRGGGGR